DSHAMGLLVGVALGILAAAGEPWEKITARVQRYPGAATFGAAVALIAMIVVMRVVKDHTYNLYRGGFLVFSVWTAIVLVVVVASPESPVTRVLGTRPLVEIGLRSYSLYLWHWPVRVFVTPRPGLHGFPLFVVRLAISVVLAEVSYRLIERPFR